MIILLGVQDVEVDSANDKVIVRGKKVDPLKVLGTLRKKYSRNAELISPKFVKLENKETKEAEKKEDKVSFTYKSHAFNFVLVSYFFVELVLRMLLNRHK